MESISRFSGKNLSSVLSIEVSTQANVAELSEPTDGGLIINPTDLEFADETEVVTIYGTRDRCSFSCTETVTEHGSSYVTQVVMEVPKNLRTTGDNIFGMSREKLLAVVHLANDVDRVMGGINDNEHVTLTVTEQVDAPAIGDNKYVMLFTWESAHPPYYISSHVVFHPDES